MRLIDADALREEWLHNGLNEIAYDTNDLLNSIDEAPTVDAVPVVRCEKCAHRTKTGECDHPRHSILPTAYPFDFCSYGTFADGGFSND